MTLTQHPRHRGSATASVGDRLAALRYRPGVAVSRHPRDRVSRDLLRDRVPGALFTRLERAIRRLPEAMHGSQA